MKREAPFVLEAPSQLDDRYQMMPSVFLAGGITSCPNWQAILIAGLQTFNGVIFNPRRAVWPEDKSEIEIQIHWERRYLQKSTLRAFWFPCETDCPITLLELGFSLGCHMPVVVGCDPKYSRKIDVQVQARLSDPLIEVVDTIEQLTDSILSHFEQSSPVEGNHG